MKSENRSYDNTGVTKEGKNIKSVGERKISGVNNEK